MSPSIGNKNEILVRGVSADNAYDKENKYSSVKLEIQALISFNNTCTFLLSPLSKFFQVIYLLPSEPFSASVRQLFSKTFNADSPFKKI